MKRNLYKRLLLFAGIPLLIMTFITACGDDSPSGVEPPVEEDLNIVETAEEAGNFTTLLSVATDLGLADVLATEELTVFAPTDDAFASLPDGLLDELSDDQLTEILLYHVLAGAVMSSQIDAQQDAETEQGERILLQSNGGVTINGTSTVISADIQATNGVIHAVDEVLLPAEFREPGIIEEAQAAGEFSILLDAIEDAGLTTTLQFLGPFTVFAPSDDAFNDLGLDVVDGLSDEQLADILTYHVLDGEVASGDLQPTQTVTALNSGELFITADNGDVTVNGTSGVFLADVAARNGTIHAVDQVLLPDAYGNVVDNAIKRYDLTTLVDLVVAQDLAGTLSDENEEFTVFAPTNDAFEEISDVVGGLNDEQVTNTLLYHVVNAAVESGDLESTQTVVTLNDGEEILIEVSDGIVTINGESTVQVADVVGTNGVIHIIDTVLIPEELGGGIPADEADATITINNVGSSAWVIDEIEGDGASAELEEENTPLTLEAERRYTIVNLGAEDHPLQLRDADGTVLISAQGDGEIHNYEPANVVVNDEDGSITFTLTGGLAEAIATYNCTPHAAMEGDIIVN
ncbi:fasciclin domain-containing protein [Rhodohalobacter sp. SW132]|uniref:fasciclin domain-containing protein n=1 Tax=Rhodohalobacter sp. SW132 TaxID=2293433 RepID=UPI000E21FE79|nr:fasciclin domain-containing protein [Rhodohalobacter sp. SW132]REL37707.1 fasciclin domain-containing protein [Rhodohalobacter sp. SW132]